LNDLVAFSEDDLEYYEAQCTDFCMDALEQTGMDAEDLIIAAILVKETIAHVFKTLREGCEFDEKEKVIH